MALVRTNTAIGNALTKQFNGFNIRIREIDGYIHASDMCKVGKSKKVYDYKENKTTIEFINALELDTGISASQLIQSKKGNAKAGAGTWVHPYVAINLAQWISPMFAVKVAGWVSKFISGDVSLIKEAVENLNNITGKVNNINVATNPEDGSAVLLLKTYEKDSFDANYEYNKLKKEMIEMENMHKGIIAEKDDKIDKLTLKIDQLINANKNNSENNDKKFNKLLGYAEETKNTLDDTNNKLDDISTKAEDTNNKLIDTNKKLDDTNKKLTEVLPQRVNIDMITDPDVPQVYILYDRNAGIDEYDLYVMRCQTSGFNCGIHKIRKKYGNNIHKIYTVKQPNAVLFWRDFKIEHKDNINKGAKSNWFRLVDIDIRQFKNNLNEFEKKRITK
jgi:hypothetical protein